MEAIAEEEKEKDSARKFLVAIDDNFPCEKALDWALKEFYRQGDQVHLVHVIPRMQRQSTYGAPPVDFLPQQDPASYEQVAKQAQQFIEQRFLPKLRGLQPQAVVHVIKGSPDAESIGSVICDLAASLPAVAVVIASQGKSKFQQFFLGSTSAYVSKSCRVPVLIVH